MFSFLGEKTSSTTAGIVVLMVLFLLIGLLCWSFFVSHYASNLKYAIAAIIGGSLAYKELKFKKIVLDDDRVVEGKLAICIGCVSGVLFFLSILFAIIKLQL